MNTFCTNTTQLTENQENKIYSFIQQSFEKRYTDDYTHFSMIGNRLNFDSFNTEVLFEIFSAKGNFVAVVEINDKKQVIKNTLKFTKC